MTIKTLKRPSLSGLATGILLALCLALLPARARAQGCSQCRDNAASTPPATQAAYRHAIILLAGTAGAIFTATLILVRRNP